VFDDLMLTDALKDFSCTALNCTALSRGALLTPNATSIGSFGATTLFTLTLP
jgi:hypothetical protein